MSRFPHQAVCPLFDVFQTFFSFAYHSDIPLEDRFRLDVVPSKMVEQSPFSPLDDEVTGDPQEWRPCLLCVVRDVERFPDTFSFEFLDASLRLG